VHSLHIPNDGRDIAEALTSGLSVSIRAVSDGSFKETFGIAAWTIGTDEEDHCIKGRVVCPGGPNSQSAYRSELTGLYCILTILHQISIYYGVKEGQVEIGCDGLSAIQSAFEKGTLLTTDYPDYDILGAILHLRKILPISISHRHVKGHQDDLSKELDDWATLNVQMDADAKQFLSQARRQPRHYDIEGEPWQLWVRGNKLTSTIQTQLYSHVQSISSEEYWGNKPGVLKPVLHTVDWQTIGKAMRTQRRTRRFFLTKHVAGMCGVGKFMKRWKEWDQDTCPRCGEYEDAPHVWQCKGQGTKAIWDKALMELEGLLRKLETDPTLMHILLSYLRAWWSGEGITYVAPREFQLLVQEQSSIGWGRFFEGWFSMHWASLQQKYYCIIRSQCSGRIWAIAIIQKLWNMAWDLWEHRNGVLHEKENLLTKSMITQLNARVSRVFSDLTSWTLRHTDRHLIHLSLFALLRKKTDYKVQWLSIAEPVLSVERAEAWRSRTRSERMVKGMRRRMISWLRK